MEAEADNSDGRSDGNGQYCCRLTLSMFALGCCLSPLCRRSLRVQEGRSYKLNRMTRGYELRYDLVGADHPASARSDGNLDPKSATPAKSHMQAKAFVVPGVPRSTSWGEL